MAHSTTLTYKCDKCGKTETRSYPVAGPIYAWEGWFSVRINGVIYHDQYKPDGIQGNGLYCPECVDTHGKTALSQHACLKAE